MAAVEITYFSDVLCILAYVAQARLDAIGRTFTEVRPRHRFVSVFGDARTKIANAWKDRDGFAGYGRHVRGVAERFPHVTVAPEVWVRVQPASSASPHLFLSGVRQWEQETRPGTQTAIFESVMWAFRRGFFAENRDIADWDEQVALAEPFGVDIDAVERHLRDGTAFAALAADYQDAEKMRIEGSPTFVLNGGRQKLYGNVGFRIIEANVAELLREPNPDEASWC